MDGVDQLIVQAIDEDQLYVTAAAGWNHDGMDHRKEQSVQSRVGCETRHELDQQDLTVTTTTATPITAFRANPGRT